MAKKIPAKSSWKHFNEAKTIDQFRGLLEVMGIAATELEAKYRSSVKFDEWNGYDYFDKDTNRTIDALVSIYGKLP